MSIDVKPIQRRFLYNGITLPDVPGLDPRAVRDLYAAQYPELLTADIEAGPVHDGVQELTFRKAVGTKGAGRGRGRLGRFAADVQAQCDGRMAPDAARMVTALQRPAAARASAACQTLVSESLATVVGAPASRRIVPPSPWLAPLP